MSSLSEQLKDKFTEKQLKKIWHTNNPKSFIEYFSIKSKEINIGKRHIVYYEKQDVDFVISELEKLRKDKNSHVKVLLEKDKNSLESQGFVSFVEIGRKLNLAKQTVKRYVIHFEIPYEEKLDPIGHVNVKVITLDNFKKLQELLSLDENKNMKKILSHKKKIELYGSLENAENKRIENMLKTRNEWSEERHDEFVNKCKETSRRIYSDPIKKKEIKDKMMDSRLKNHGTWENYSKTMVENINKTLIEKYGSLEEANKIRYESKIKNLEKKGISKDEFYKQVIDKMLKTCSEKYNNGEKITNVSQLSLWKEKVLDFWENLSEDELNEIINKYRKTCMERYGVETTFDFVVSGKYHYDNLIFDSKWEIYFYQYLKDNNIDFEYHTKDLVFDYFHNGIQCKYYADFKVNNIVYEIKGDHFFNDKDELINPFDLTDDRPKSKQKCMQENNVVVLRQKDILKYEDWFNEHHSDIKLEKFRKSTI